MRLVPSVMRARLALITALLIAVLGLFVPARALVGQRGDIEHLTTRLAALEAENARLAKEVARLEDPAELEVLARERLGLVKPGEQAYFFVDPGSSETERSEASSSPEAWWTRAWDWMVGLVGGRG